MQRHIAIWGLSVSLAVSAANAGGLGIRERLDQLGFPDNPNADLSSLSGAARPAPVRGGSSGIPGLAWRSALSEAGPQAVDLGALGPLNAGARARQDPCLLLRRIDAAVRQGSRFLLSHQMPDGSWGVRMEYARGWNETHMRVPITAQVLMALRAAGAEVPERARNDAMQFIRANMLRSRADLSQGEDMPYNNDTPYAQAYSLSLLLQLYESSQGAERAGYARDVRALLARIASGSLRYGSTRSGQATFQLAMLADPLLRARQLGFALPPAPSRASYDRETDDLTLARNRPAFDAARALGAGLLGAGGNPLAMLGNLAPGVIRSTTPNNPGATRDGPAARASTGTAAGAAAALLGAAASGNALGAAALAAAAQPPQDILDLLLTLMASARTPDGSFTYRVGNPQFGGEAGAAVRSVMVESSLTQAGHPGAGNLDAAIARFMRFQGEMSAFVQNNSTDATHSAQHGWARYYYLPGIQAAVDALTHSASETAARDLTRLGWALVDMQARDGSWVDSPEASGPNYGTATAMIALLQMRRHLTTAPATRDRYRCGD